MKTSSRSILFFLLASFIAGGRAVADTNSSKSPVEISMISATSMVDQLPFEALWGKGWKTEKGIRFVKLDIHPDESIEAGKIEVESCGEPFQDNVTLYRWDERLADGKGKRIVSWEWRHILDSKGTKGGLEPVSFSSLTFNFNQNEGICIKEIRFFDDTGSRIPIKPSRVVEGNVTASTIQEPQQSYHPMNLFDSRFEYAWAAKDRAINESLEFNFDKPQRVEKIKIWNGYQRSDVHHSANSRVRSFRLEGDGGYAVTVSVKDTMGPQVISLSTPFSGKRLKMIAQEVYPGNKYKDLVISEMRFFDGNDWFLVNSLPAFQTAVQHNRNQFEKAGLNILDKTFYSYRERDKDKKQSSTLMVRFRSDGSLYLENYYSKGKKWESLYALGNYEVTNLKDGISLRVFGLLEKEEGKQQEDKDCGDSVFSGKQKIFQEFFAISKQGDAYVIVNTSKNKNFKFDKFLLYPGSEEDYSLIDFK